jgi:chemotaxis protein methyltransferase WspC
MEAATQIIAELLEQSIGLTVRSIGASTFIRALNNRKRLLGIDDDEAYLEKLIASYMELRSLVEEVVIPETWFFRDQEPFSYLKEYVVNSTKDLSVDIFRILSLPCSTGEEPYSIAMTLLEAGLKPASFYIDGVDVSGRALAVARRGLYRSNSFRTKNMIFRDNFFHQTQEGYSLNAMVREKVRFLQGNILQPGFLDSLGRYDVVFCRNILIYFNKDSQKQAIKSLYDLLVPQGLLFTGHSEASLFMDTRFVPVAHSRAFAFHKKTQMGTATWKSELSADQKLKEQNTEMPSRVTFGAVVPARSHSQRSGFVKATSQEPRKINQEQEEFIHVQKMADAGDIEEAALLSEKYLRQYGPSAKWYYLLGVIRDSQGKTEEALKFFRKAVYLDPENVESLIQLSLLAERAGNMDTAENYKRRARKIQEKN